MTKEKKNIISRCVMCGAFILCFFAGTIFSPLEAGAAASSIINRHNKNFTKPEDAIEYYVKKISEGDFSGALDACAGNGGFDFVAFSEEAGFIIPFNQWPDQYKMYKDMNEIYDANNLVKQTKELIWSLLEPDIDFAQTYSTQTLNAAEISNNLNPSRLASLEVVRMEDDYIRESNKQKMADNCKKMAKRYRADEYKEYAVLYKWEDGYYSGGYTLLKFGKNWNILGPYATYWGSTQELTETTEKAFNQKIVDYKKEK